MNLLILPGGGSKDAENYRSVYTLLEDAAKERGYKEIQVAHYPGQVDDKRKIIGEGTLTGSVKATSVLVKQFADKGPFRIIARSFGCTVALMAVKEAGLTNVKEIVLWGPFPFWGIWERFKKDFKTYCKKHSEKMGVNISENYFDSEEPIEYHLLKYTCDTPIIISSGAGDKTECPPSFFNYLKEICIGKDNIRFVGPVYKAKHTMRPGDPGMEGYLNMLFADYSKSKI